jgi:hypothetical protein
VLATFFVAPLFALPARPSPPPSTPYFGKPPARMTLVTRPLGFDPDGNARWLVLTKFFDASGAVTRIMANSDFSWTSPNGRVQWQTRMRFGQPSAILITNRDGPIAVTAHANYPKLGTVTVHGDTRRWRQSRVSGAPLGAHAVQIGWFPQERFPVVVERVGAPGRRVRTIVPPPSSAYFESALAAARTYRYEVYRRDRGRQTVTITTRSEPRPTALANVSGKGMWLFFTTNPLDDSYYARLDPHAIAERAARAGLRYVELRLAYGAYWEAEPQAKATIDAIVDGLAARGIGTIAWTVPRDLSFEDVAASVRAAYYRTWRGTPVRGLAIDVERGGDFMGDDPNGIAALWQYVGLVRRALGPRYLIVTDVEDPYLEHLDNAAYPYARIARYSSVLQPMIYWRMARGVTKADQVGDIIRASLRTLRRVAGTRLPVSIGAQTSGEGPGGSPPAAEITASLDEARNLGALGECFFAWNGTRDDQWEALERYAW